MFPTYSVQIQATHKIENRKRTVMAHTSVLSMTAMNRLVGKGWVALSYKIV